MTDENMPVHQQLSDEDLDELAEYYDRHDTSQEMEDGQWVDPREGTTTSGREPDIR